MKTILLSLLSISIFAEVKILMGEYYKRCPKGQDIIQARNLQSLGSVEVKCGDPESEDFVSYTLNDNKWGTRLSTYTSKKKSIFYRYAKSGKLKSATISSNGETIKCEYKWEGASLKPEIKPDIKLCQDEVNAYITSTNSEGSLEKECDPNDKLEPCYDPQVLEFTYPNPAYIDEERVKQFQEMKRMQRMEDRCIIYNSCKQGNTSSPR